MKPDNELIGLIRQVKEVTGWNDTEDILRKYSLREEPLRLSRPPEGADIGVLAGSLEWELPLYTAEYLLGKLPKRIDNRFLTLEVCDAHDSLDWTATYYGLEDAYLFSEYEADKTHSNNPLKALLKLVIALHEADEL